MGGVLTAPWLQRFKTSTGLTWRSPRERAEDVLNVLDYGADKTGASPGTFHTALEAAWAVARTKTRAHIRIPYGTFRVNEPINLTNFVTGATEVTIEGAGSWGTHIIAPAGIGEIFKVGDITSLEYTTLIKFKGFRTTVNGTEVDDVHFRLVKCRDISFDDIYFNAGQCGVEMGNNAVFTVTIDNSDPDPATLTAVAHGLAVNTPFQLRTTGALPTGFTAATTYYVLTVPTADTFTASDTQGGDPIVTSSAGSGTHTLSVGEDNDCIFIRFQDCGARIRNAGEGPVIRLGSGGVLKWGGVENRSDSSGGNTFIDYVHPTYSWDGIYVTDLHGEDFKYYYNQTVGKNCGNINWIGGQTDGATVAFNVVPPASGSIRGLNVQGVSVRQCAKFVNLDTSASSSNICGVHIIANECNKIDTQFLETISGGAGTLFGFAALNQIRNGGSTGTELFKIGANSDFVVGPNFAYDDPVEAPADPYTYAITFADTSGHEIPGGVYKDFATARSNRIPRTARTYIYQATNTAASTPNNMNLAGINNVNSLVVPDRAGRILEMGCGVNAPVVAGSMTVFPRINTTDHNASMVCTLDSSNQTDRAVSTNDGIPYAAGDTIHLRYSPDGSWNPTGSNDLSAWVTIIDDA